jgi:DNA polymerase III sliding clamp (beta) subunit (PCNA family)
MKLNRDQFFKAIQRMRKHLVQGQVDAWHGMIRLLRGQAQHDKQLEIQASASGVEWSEWIDAEFGPGDYYGPKDTVNTPPDKDLTLARVGCEVLYHALKDRFDLATDINLVVEEGYLKLTSPKDARHREPVLLPREPTHLQAGVEHTHKIESKTLHALLSQAAFARSKDETRPHLTGVELSCASAGLRATTTDGHRLATAVANSVWPDHTEWTILLPGAAVDSLLASLRGCVDETVELAIGPKALVVEGSTFAVSAAAVDGNFPPWRQVCPREDEGTRMVFGMDVEVQGLRNVIAQATKTAKTGPANVNGIFTFDHEWLTIQVVDAADPEKVLETVRTEIAGPVVSCYPKTLQTSFNLTCWREALDSIPREHAITIQYDHELDPVAIYAGNATHVIMPCRLR